MNDPILEMSEKEIQDACCKILNIVWRSEASLVGLIIYKLQEREVRIVWHPSGWLIGGSCYYEPSLQKAFLRTAIIEGHWTPPQKVKEEPQDLEDRVERLEIYMKSMTSYFSNLSKKENP